MAELHGVLVVDKPSGPTSAAVVARVKRALGGGKAGHTGTLDPLATGVLPLCLGQGTKLAGHLLAEDKAYEAELILGIETDSYDAEGEVTARAPEAAARVDEAAVRAALVGLTGTIAQVPPRLSAIKQGGRRLHKLVRAGEPVDPAPRTVTIHRLALVGWTPATAVAPPRARIEVECAKGTYVRSLAADVGRALGCGAHLGQLRRTRSGRFTLADAVPLDAILADPAVAAARLIPPSRALALPSVTVPSEAVRAVVDGRPPPDLAPGTDKETELFQMLTPDGELLAIARCDAGGVRLVRVFTYALTGGAPSSKLPRSKT
jgi:tRNA pseudouridine55 synthase